MDAYSFINQQRNKIEHKRLTGMSLFHILKNLRHFSRSQAASANIRAFHSAIDSNFCFMYVGIKPALAKIVRMTDIVPNLRLLSTYCTDFRHIKLLNPIVLSSFTLSLLTPLIIRNLIKKIKEKIIHFVMKIYLDFFHCYSYIFPSICRKIFGRMIKPLNINYSVISNCELIKLLL